MTMLDPDWLEQSVTDMWWSIAIIIGLVLALVGLGVWVGWLVWS